MAAVPSPHLLTAESLDEYLGRLFDVEGLKGLGLGKGANSVVFEHPKDPNIVVKVSIDDQVYMSFVRFCRRNPLNRWTPHIWDLKKLDLIEEPTREVWAVFMPKLKPASEKLVADTFATEVAPWTDFHSFTKTKRLSYPQWRNVMHMTEDESLRDLAIFLLRNFRYLDLGARNFMKRDNQLVFNDPLADRL